MFARRTATRIKKGKAQKKNRHARTPNYWNACQDDIQLDVENPGKGYKHFLKKRDIRQFLEILPNRDEIDVKFDAVLLCYGSSYIDGWYQNGVVGISAWPKEMTQAYSLEYFQAHKALFERLEVKYKIGKDTVTCYFTENQIKAFQLLHILLHELGHHHDRITTKSKRRSARGENYAENYAFKCEEIIWNKYFECFGY